MKHNIDPKVDCVFKALLGAEDNRNLLVHFLNAVLGAELSQPIVSVVIINPYNDKEFLNDKLSIVDVKASDQNGRIYQIEVQLAYYTDLPARMVYTWSDIYCKQLQSGSDFANLKPTYSIWLLGKNAVKDDENYIHAYKLRDETGKLLTEHGGIWLLELEKFSAAHIENEQERWLQFFKKGDLLNDEQELPDWMNTQEMRQAMSTLRQFSEKDKDYFAYQARQNYIRQQMSVYGELDATRQAKNEALHERDEAVSREQQALAERNALVAERDAVALREQQAMAEIEKLKALLADKK
jgi:predicted transposase/invertase (TIGR01784 family)